MSIQKNIHKSVGLLVIAALFMMCGISMGAERLPITVDMSPFNPKALPGPYPSTRERVCLNGTWDFYPIIDRERKYGPELETLPPVPKEREWVEFRVPAKWNGTQSDLDITHDVPRHWQNANRAWYRRNFKVPESMKGRRIKLHFESVLVYTEVFVNDISVGKHYSGVTPFSLDITHAVKIGGTNSLRMYVANADVHYIKPPASRYDFSVRAPFYYSYYAKSAGIWQDVFLLAEPDLIVDDGQIITSVRLKQIKANITLVNSGIDPIMLDVAPVVTDNSGKPVKTFAGKKVTVPPSETTTLEFHEDWDDPKLWSPEEPNLYYLNTKLFSNGKLADEHFQRFGFREFWIEGKNLMLNGRRISLLGSWSGFTGTAYDVWTRPEYMRLYLKTLKEANFMGTRMNIESPHAMDICDEIGLPVIATGISDGAVFFDPSFTDEGMRHALEDTRDWLRQNRNHPSILIWSTENEDNISGKGKIYDRYMEIDRLFTKMDPTRPFMHDGSPGFDDVPIENRHYDGKFSSLERQIHLLEEWDRSGTRPRIEGEIHPVGNEFFWEGLFRYIGDRAWRDIDYRYRQWDRIIRMQGGGLRASGSSGFMLHNADWSMFKSPIWTTLLPDDNRNMSRALKFVWDDLSTPYPKPRYLNAAPLDLFNPWTDAAPPVIRTPMFETIRHIFSPVLVTLAHATEHTYWNDLKAKKDVYVINESPKDLSDVRLHWRLSIPDGKELGSGEIPCSFKQGERRLIQLSFSFPEFQETTDLNLHIKLETDQGQELSSDFMEITVYQRPAKLQWHDTDVFLYDQKGRTEKILILEKIPHKKVTVKEFNSLPAEALLIIGHNSASPGLLSAGGPLSRFVSKGGKVLVMEENINRQLSRSVAFIRAPGHPLFRGLPKERLELWRSKSREISSSYIDPALGQTALLEVVNSPSDGVYSDYVPVIVESTAARGRTILCNLNITDSYEEDDPEAVIMLRNLLDYAASPVAVKKTNVYYAGDDLTKRFFTDTLMVENLLPASLPSLTDGLHGDEILVIGNGIDSSALKEQKSSLEEFVENGGIILCTGGWSKDTLLWLPVSLSLRKLPQDIKPPFNYSTGAFHLWKRTDNHILNGLGDLYIFDSSRARNYYIGDQISGLEYGFVRPDPPWTTGYEIAIRETSGYKGKYRLPHYDSEGDAALVVLQHGKGSYILSTVPVSKTGLSMRLYGALMTNLNVPSGSTFSHFSGK